MAEFDKDKKQSRKQQSEDQFVKVLCDPEVVANPDDVADPKEFDPETTMELPVLDSEQFDVEEADQAVLDEFADELLMAESEEMIALEDEVEMELKQAEHASADGCVGEDESENEWRLVDETEKRPQAYAVDVNFKQMQETDVAESPGHQRRVDETDDKSRQPDDGDDGSVQAA